MSRPFKNRRVGYVYLLKAEGHRYFKIGRAFVLTRRLTQLQALMPFKIRFVHAIACADCFEAERRLHARFKSKRLRGEWFSLEPEDVRWFRDIMCHPSGPDAAQAFEREGAGPIRSKLPRR